MSADILLYCIPKSEFDYEGLCDPWLLHHEEGSQWVLAAYEESDYAAPVFMKMKYGEYLVDWSPTMPTRMTVGEAAKHLGYHSFMRVAMQKQSQKETT